MEVIRPRARPTLGCFSKPFEIDQMLAGDGVERFLIQEFRSLASHLAIIDIEERRRGIGSGVTHHLIHLSVNQVMIQGERCGICDLHFSQPRRLLMPVL